jgi:hypothetical protein
MTERQGTGKRGIATEEAEDSTPVLACEGELPKAAPSRENPRREATDTIPRRVRTPTFK